MASRTAHITVIIGADRLRSIGDHAILRAPAEVCGVLMGVRANEVHTINRVVESPNVTTGNPETTYRIDPNLLVELLFEARRTSQSVLGFYHSHTQGPTTPSSQDFKWAWREKSYLIIGVADGGVTGTQCWRRSSGGTGFVEDHFVIKTDY